MHLLFFLMQFLLLYHYSYLFLSIVSYTILTQLSSACCLRLEAFTRCASWPGNSAHLGVTHIATLRSSLTYREMPEARFGRWCTLTDIIISRTNWRPANS
jgi:hypothetical protein